MILGLIDHHRENFRERETKNSLRGYQTLTLSLFGEFNEFTEFFFRLIAEWRVVNSRKIYTQCDNIFCTQQRKKQYLCDFTQNQIIVHISYTNVGHLSRDDASKASFSALRVHHLSSVVTPCQDYNALSMKRIKAGCETHWVTKAAKRETISGISY